MAFTFYYTQMPAGAGGAIYRAQAEKVSFARRIEMARLQMERQRLEMAQAKQLAEVSDMEWRRRAAEQQAEEKRQAAALEQAMDQIRLGTGMAAEKRLQTDLADRLSGGPEQRRLQLALAQEQARQQARTPERLQKARVDLAKAGFRLVDPASPATGERVPLGDGEVWERPPKASEGKYTPYASRQITNLGAQIRTIEKKRDADLKEAEALQTQLAKLLRNQETGEYIVKGDEAKAQKIRETMAGLKSSEWYDGEIARRQQEIQRLIDAEMPEDERAAQKEAETKAAREVSQKRAMELAEAMTKVKWQDKKSADAAALALQTLRSGTPEDKQKALGVVLRLVRRSTLDLDTSGVLDVSF